MRVDENYNYDDILIILCHIVITSLLHCINLAVRTKVLKEISMMAIILFSFFEGSSLRHEWSAIIIIQIIAHIYVITQIIQKLA